MPAFVRHLELSPRLAACRLAACALGVALLGGTTGCDRIRALLEDESTPADADAPAGATTPATDENPANADAAAKAESDDAVDKAPGKTPDLGAPGDDPSTDAPTEDADTPIVLSNIQLSPQGGMFGKTGAMKLTAQAKLNDKIDNSTYVHVKGLCKAGDLLLADTGYVNADYQKPLQQYEVGQEASITGMLFTQGLNKAPAPCELEFRLAGSGGGISLPLGHACFDGSEVKNGACDPPITPVAVSGATQPIEVHDLEISGTRGLGSRGGLAASYVLKFNEAQQDSTRLTLKSACEVEDTKFVDMGMTNLMSGPFEFGAGEAVARASNLYWNPAFGFSEPPSPCDITIAMWQPKSGSFGEYEETVLQRACFRDKGVRDGPCDPDAPEPEPATPADDDSMRLSNVSMEVVEPYGAKGDKFQLKIQADLTIEQRVDQRTGVNAKVTCKVGKTARVETAYLYGIELHYLDPGETTRMTSTAFTSNAMEAKPRTCIAEFTGGQRFSPTGDDGVDLGKWCWRGGKLKKGKC